MDDLSPALDLPDHLLLLLQEKPEGRSEYELIQQLKRRHSTHVPNLPLTDKLVLFRTHFLVFNALYLLRDRLWAEGSGHLQISPLHIQLLPYASAAAGLAEQDALREYYLDLSNLRDTDEDDVERLLASFWTRMQGSDEKRAALELFELDRSPQPLTLELVSLHHPDRGGSTQRLQSINLAMEILARYYR